MITSRAAKHFREDAWVHVAKDCAVDGRDVGTSVLADALGLMV